MLIHSDMLQKLVDKIIKDIGYNINIIDTNGIIIASGSAKRIGKFHKVGKQAADNKCRIDIHKADEELYNDVKSGINLPFYYKDTLIGVIGITGQPSQIRDLTNIVKSMIELMYEQELLKQKMYYRQNNKVFFINELLNITDDEGIASIKNWGEKLGYDMSVRRCCIILQFYSSNLEMKLFETEEISQEFIKELKQNVYHHKNDMTAFLSKSRILIFKSSYELDETKEKANMQDYIKGVIDSINSKYSMNYCIGVGSYYDDLLLVKESFFEAEYLIRTIKNINDKKVGFIHDYLFGYFASKLPERMIEHFFIESYDKIKDIPEMKETIISLYRCNMHLSHSATDLFVHRNTILFRMNKLREILNIDPVNNNSDRTYLNILAEYILMKK